MSEQTVNDLATKKARKSPEWLTKSIMYQLYLRSFTADGTLKAAKEKLPELKELGIDIVYLCPICVQDDDMRREFWSARQSKFNNPRNPYRIKDFYNIDEEYGNDADLHEFVETAHGLGLKVMLDIVFYHCGPTAVFIDEHPDFVKRKEDGSVKDGGWNFPELNFESEGLREYLWKNLEYWVEKFKVDGYRCDVSDSVPLDFWEAARTRLEKLNPEVIILSEGQRVEDQLSAFDMNYCFSGTGSIHNLFLQNNPVADFRKTWENMEAERPKGTRFIRYIDNHDIAHDVVHGNADWYGACRLDKAWGIPAIDAILALCFSLDGVPLIYNGQEVVDLAHHSIYNQVPVEWENKETPEGKKRWNFCKQLCGLRHSEKALAYGSLKWLDNDTPDNLLSFIREKDLEKIVVLVNLSDKKITSSIKTDEDLSGFKPLVSSGVKSQGSEFEIDAFGYALLRK
jgi:glycosidase